MKKFFSLQTPAKINLYLKVINKRSDGYHNLSSLMQMVGLYDLLTFQEAVDGIHLDVQNGLLPSGASNLVFRAASLLQKCMVDEGYPQQGVSISLRKGIPVAAGLAGGSSDGVATLVGLNRLWALGWPQEKLSKLSENLGSDLPFFFYGPTAWVSGRGEMVDPVQTVVDGWVVLVHPEIQISTASVFADSGWAGLTKKGAPINIHSKERRPAVAEIIRQPVNDLEKITLRRFPALKRMKTAIKGVVGRPVLMSGSGPTFYAFFEDRGKAEAASVCLGKMNSPYPVQVWVAPLLRESPYTSLFL